MPLKKCCCDISVKRLKNWLNKKRENDAIISDPFRVDGGSSVWVWVAQFLFWHVWFWAVNLVLYTFVLLLILLYYLGYFAIDCSLHMNHPRCAPDMSLLIKTLAGGLLANLFILLNVTHHHRSILINISSAITEDGNRAKREVILSRSKNVIESTKKYGKNAIISGLALVFVYFLAEDLASGRIGVLILEEDLGRTAIIRIKFFLLIILAMLGFGLIIPVSRNDRETSMICQCFMETRLPKD